MNATKVVMRQVTSLIGLKIFYLTLPKSYELFQARGYREHGR